MHRLIFMALMVVVGTPHARAQEAAPHTYSTKQRPSPFGAPTSEAGAGIAPMPFGKSTAAQDKAAAPVGPKGVDAVPVENVDTIETGEPAPAEPDETGANPVQEDVSQPTELTAPMFSAETAAIKRMTVLRVLNKVTARSETLAFNDGQAGVSGKLLITSSHCQHSNATSLPDDAALITVAEMVKGQPNKAIFSGWIYQSSPSINGLEHPIYDISLVACKDPVVAEAAEEKGKKTAAPKKKASK